MYIKKVLIENFRGIRKMELELNRQMNVFIGVNGAGKSSVLDALAMSLSWWDACWQKRKGASAWSGEPLQYYDITNGEQFASCSVEMHLDENYPDEKTYWTVVSDSKHGQQNYADLIFTPNFESLRRTVSKLLDEEDVYLPPPAMYFPIDRTECYFRDSSEIPNTTLNEILSKRVPALETLQTLFLPFLETKEPFTASIRTKRNYRNFLEWMNRLQKTENIKLRELQELGVDVSDPASYQSPQLIAVKKAWSALYSNSITNFIIKEHTDSNIGFGLYLSCRKNGVEIFDNQLSGGEKAILALVGSLAQSYTDSHGGGLEKHGVVLIDEIDLHLHPKWQRTVLSKLMEIFPNTQFIVTTHSPQVIGELQSEHVIRLEETDSGIIAIPANGETFGMTSDMVLATQMDSTERNQAIQDKLEAAFRALEYGNLEKAREIKAELENKAKDIPELQRLDMRISLKESSGK